MLACFRPRRAPHRRLLAPLFVMRWTQADFATCSARTRSCARSLLVGSGKPRTLDVRQATDDEQASRVGQANLAHISREHSTAIRPQSRSMPIHMNVYMNLPAGRRPPRRPSQHARAAAAAVQPAAAAGRPAHLSTIWRPPCGRCCGSSRVVMIASVKCWGRGSSLNTQKVLWALAELDMDCELVLTSNLLGPDGLSVRDRPKQIRGRRHSRVPGAGADRTDSQRRDRTV
jgi:hypothetical protein